MTEQLQALLCAAKQASRKLATLSADKKNQVLLAIATALTDNSDKILAANAVDVENAKGHISESMIDRLSLTKARIEGMAKGVREVVDLPDPVGKTLDKFTRPNGIRIQKVSVPLGVIAIIYESRPNVTADAAALCLKSGNVCILRGGKDAYLTSKTIVDVIRACLKAQGLDENFVCMPEDNSRESATALMTAVGYVDALIPRGGAGLIRSCVENAKIPCIQTGTGICHVYVDKKADLQKAWKIVENAKTSRPAVCNAEEVLLVHSDVAKDFLPTLQKMLCADRAARGEKAVELRLDSRAAEIIDGVAATEQDFDTEFLDYILAVKIVDSVEEAIVHITAHSTGHSDCIVTEDEDAATLFTACVDSAAVYVNVSTRFTDGGEFGKGCEIGISTQKLHARGPMGLEELTSYRYVVTGDGQTR